MRRTGIGGEIKWYRERIGDVSLTGARLGEILDLTWDDMDLRRRALQGHQEWVSDRHPGGRDQTSQIP